MTDARPTRLSRKVALQQIAMLWERVWAALNGPILSAGLAVAVVASGLLASLPVIPRLVLAGLLGAGFLFSLRGLFRLVWPRRLEAMRRMERASAVGHRPLSAASDTLAPEILDPLSDAVWEEHQRRQLLALDKIRLSPPRSTWAKFDPMALRVPVLLLAAVALILGPGSLTSNIRDAAQVAPAAAPVPLTLDAWLKPPGYTGKPPLLLSAPSMQERLASADGLAVPDQSLFTLRVSGAKEPKLQLLDSTGKPLADATPRISAPAAGVLAAEYKLTRPVTIVVRDGDKELAQYPLAVIPDAPPTIALTKPPEPDLGGTLVTEWLAKDDYGVASVAGTIELADEQDGGIGFESNGVFLFDPPQLKFTLRRPNAREEQGKTTHDLASHPWAGLRVNLTLTAKDGAGQEGQSPVVSFKLPERQFVKPMAQAIIEQRKQLIMYPEKVQEIGEALDTLMLYPDGLIERSGDVLAVSMLASRLRNASGYDDVKYVVQGLWDVAVAIDEGSLQDAKSELQALKKELEKALQDGAPKERITELMNKMRDAMDRYMEAMRKEAERRMRDGTLQRPPPGQQGRSMTQQDLQKMLDALENMAKNGSREMAEQLLNQLDRMLQNMQPGMSDQAQGDDGMNEMMDQLNDMMKKQQGLMDDTMRQPGEGQEGDQGQMGQQGEQGEEGNRGRQPGNGMGGLADRQQSLQQMLDGLMGKGLGQLPGELGDAGRSMKNAEDALRNNDRDGALREQGEALDKLRKGAGKLAQQMRENGQGQAESDARDGEGRGGRDDPLGRPRATRNPDDGPDQDILPNEQAMKRAREILETLRAKSNEQGLTDSERGYIERLLRGLY
ncbi:TIGR02302 family protein [Aestuariivirga sp.]|uniref:TIGR02302 family protein n=1 Tax=Aestuariivirga sp. TaxID=2650926 RepID=UPI0039E6E96F